MQYRRQWSLICAFFCSVPSLALAFCDWSDVQKARREMLISHTFPRKFSMSFTRLSDISQEHLQQLSLDIKQSMDRQKSVSVKPLVNEACANIFTQYFTTRSFDQKDDEFKKLLKNFDKVFWEVNQVNIGIDCLLSIANNCRL